MSDIDVRQPSAPFSALPGADVLWRVRRLLGWAIGTGVVYSVIGGASKMTCPGGVTGDGGYLDAEGRPTEVAPQCATVTLEPAGFAYVVIAVVVFVTISRVVRFSADQADAIRRIDRAIIGIVVFALVWTAVTQASFAGISMDGWDGIEPFFFDGTYFGNIVVDVSPMPE